MEDVARGNNCTERFGQFAQRYVSSPSHAEGKDLERILEIAQPQSHWSALDIATGGGHTARLLAPHVARLVATDLSGKMLEAAQDFLRGQGIDNVTFRLAAAESLPFEDGSFDLVTCRIAPHHFRDVKRFVFEAARVLKPGGLFIVEDHLAPEDALLREQVERWERLRDPSHVQALSESGWAGLLQEAGLTVEVREEHLKRQKFRRWTGMQDCSPETVKQLEEMVFDGSPEFLAWQDARDFGASEASFQTHLVLLSARKDGLANR